MSAEEWDYPELARTPILVCGSRTWNDREVMEMILQGVLELDAYKTVSGPYRLIHGDAPGADRMARALVNESNEKYRDSDYWTDIETFPADWNQFGKSAGPRRNQLMLAAKPNLVVAFIDKPLAESRGTAHMVSLARGARIKTIVIESRRTSSEEDK